MAAYSLADFQDFLRNTGNPKLERLADLAGKYPDMIEPYLPALGKRVSLAPCRLLTAFCRRAR